MGDMPRESKRHLRDGSAEAGSTRRQVTHFNFSSSSQDTYIRHSKKMKKRFQDKLHNHQPEGTCRWDWIRRKRHAALLRDVCLFTDEKHVLSNSGGNFQGAISMSCFAL